MRQPPGPIFVSAPFFRSGRRTSVFPPPRRLPNPHAGPARSRRSSVPRPRFSVSRTNPAFCPSDRLFCRHSVRLPGCPAVRTPPPVDTALRPAGPILRPPQSQSGPLWPHPTDRETHRPVSEPDPTVAGNRPFGALRLRSLPCHTAIPPRIGKGRCAPPHSAAAPRRQTADPHCPSSEHRLHRTASDTRSSIHGSRGAPNPEHASRHARSPGGGRPVRKRRREPTDARTCRYSSDARSSMHAPRCTDLAGHRIRNTHPGTHEVRGAVPCGSVDANRPTQEPVGIAPMHGSRYTRLDARTSRGIESGTRIPAHPKSGEGRPSRAEASTRTDRRKNLPA